MDFQEPFLVVGSRGMLGTDLLACLVERGKRVVGVDIEEIDIRRKESVSRVIAEYRPGTIINVAAFTDVDGCESHQEEAYAVNALGPANLAEIISETGGTLLHMSTDYVFNGRKGTPYIEADKLDPVGVYGKSKAQGEERVRDILPDGHCIVRTQWLYGLHGKNFVEAILNAAKKQKVLNVVNDQYGCPTYSVDLAKALVDLGDKGVTGTVHISNTGEATWHEFATAILELAGPANVLVEPTTTEALGRPAPRPGYSVLDNSKFAQIVGTPLRHWREALKDYLRARIQKAGASA